MPAPALLEPLVPVLAGMHPVGIRLPHQGAHDTPVPLTHTLGVPPLGTLRHAAVHGVRDIVGHLDDERARHIIQNL